MAKIQKQARTVRRARMVAAKVAGKSTAAIARTEGMSRYWTAAELASLECRQILAGLVGDSMARVQNLYTKSLDAIEAALDANKVVVAEGCALNLGADHFARLTAAKRFLELVTVGRPVPRQPEESRAAKTITLEELKELVDQSKAVVQ